MGRPSKLTPHQQREAIARRDAGEALTDIARTFGVSHTTIGRLVPNANEQAALKHGRGMQANGDSLRSIAGVWMSEFGLGQYDAKTVQRILAREEGVSPLSLRGPAS
jgi:transposase